MTRNHAVRTAVLGMALFSIVVAGHFIEPPLLSRTAKSLIRSFHGPGFAVITFVLVWLLKTTPTRPKRFLVAAIGALLAGIVSELAQLYGERDASLQDLLADAVGICAGLGIAAISDSDIRSSYGRGRMIFITLLTSTFVVAAAFKPVSLAYVLVSRNSALPMLLTFEAPWENSLYRESGLHTSDIETAPESWPVSSDSNLLRAEATGKYNTFLHLWPYPDWRNFEKLSFIAATADNRTYEVTVTLRDMARPPANRRNGFHQRFYIGPTPNRYEIILADIVAKPGGRQFDIGNIDEIVFSTSSNNRPATLLIDDIRLQ